MKFYLDDVLTHTNGNEQDHTNKISTEMKRLQQHNLKVKASKYDFLKQKLSCLGYKIITSVICPQMNKIEATLQMAPHATRKLLQGFLGMLNYYHRLHPISKINTQPLASLTSPKVKF